MDNTAENNGPVLMMEVAPPAAPAAPTAAGHAMTSVALTNKTTGKEVGVRLIAGTCTAKELKAALKARGLSSREVTREFNRALGDERTVRRIMGIAAVEELASRGKFLDYVDIRKNGATARFVNVERDPIADQLAEARAEIERLKAEAAKTAARNGRK